MVFTVDLDLRISELDLYFSREQEQCLKNFTLPVNPCLTSGRLVFIRGAFKDKFPFSPPRF